MKNSIKQSLILSLLLFVSGMGYAILISSSALDSMCNDFSITAMATQPSAECTGLFNDTIVDSTIWISLWAVLAFFIFLIFIEHFLPAMEKKKPKRTKPS